MALCIPPSWFAVCIHISSTWHAVCFYYEEALTSKALMTREKHVIMALIIATMTQRYQAVDVVAIITCTVRGSCTNCFECNQIFTLECFSSIHFEPCCLSLDEVRAQKENQHAVVYIRINLHCVNVWAGCIWGLCVCVSAPDWAWQPCTISCSRTQLHKGQRNSIKCFG